MPGGTLTVLHTDIENSTPLTLFHGERYPAVLARHGELVRAAIREHGGYEVDTQGDSFFVVFTRTTQALKAAVSAQQALAAEDWPEDGAVKVRMGIHTGELMRTESNYTGLDVVRGARIRDSGHGGQVLLSKATAALVQDALVDGLSLRDMGLFRLKGIPPPERIFQLVIPELPADFPPLNLVKVDDRPNLAPSTKRVLTTLCYIDLVESTKVVVTLGDRAWLEMQEQYLTIVRRELSRSGGTEISAVGDGVLASFEGPTAAIRCVEAIQLGLQEIDMVMKASIHSGEVEMDGGSVNGITVFTCIRIAAKAEPGEILVSNIVTELVTGAGISFADRGIHTLKGIPGEWRLFVPEEK